MLKAIQTVKHELSSSWLSRFKYYERQNPLTEFICHQVCNNIRYSYALFKKKKLTQAVKVKETLNRISVCYQNLSFLLLTLNFWNCLENFYITTAPMTFSGWDPLCAVTPEFKFSGKRRKSCSRIFYYICFCLFHELKSRRKEDFYTRLFQAIISFQKYCIELLTST